MSKTTSKNQNANSMDRRTFLKGSVGAATVAAIPNVAAAATPKKSSGKRYEWKMVTTWPEKMVGLGEHSYYLAKTINELSGGRINVTVYPGGKLCKPFDSLDFVSKGSAEMTHGISYYWKNSPAQQFFATVPFGLNATEMMGWIQYGGAQELWDELYAGMNLKPFACGNCWVQLAGWFTKEVNSLDDFKGLRMRYPGLAVATLKKYGAEAVTLPAADILNALKENRLDVAEWGNPYMDLDLRLHEAAKYYYWPGWHEPGTVIEATVNKKTWDKLPKDLQVVVKHACQSAYYDMLGLFSARNNEALQVLIHKHGVKLRRFNNDILTKLGEEARNIVADLGTKDAFTKKVYESFEKFRSQGVQWSEISEEGFSAARSLVFR